MKDKLLKLSENFWNIRGTFRAGGIVNIGTQTSLVRTGPRSFVFLDSYTLAGPLKEQVMELTNDGKDVEAVINLHPYHTIHCGNMQRDFPQAQMYGSKRHEQKWKQLSWKLLPDELGALESTYPDLEFSLPRGVEFISSNEFVHFSSILAYHKPSKTLHVDDTLLYIEPAGPLGLLGKKLGLFFHPALSKVLDDSETAASDFIEWANEIAVRWGEVETICAAHSAVLKVEKGEFPALIQRALQKASKTLETHRRRYR